MNQRDLIRAQQAAAAVSEAALVEAVRSLVRIPSFNGAEVAAQQTVADLMTSAGLAVDTWPIDLGALAKHRLFSTEIPRARGDGLVGTLHGTGTGPTLVLNGHVDVVPPGDERLWSEDPFSGALRDGRIWGRGALDMKGPLLAGLFALRAVREARVTLRGSVLLHSVIGEEDGGLGTLATLLRGHVGDAAIVLEPTDLRVVPTAAGCLNFRVRSSGRAAHGAFRTEGRSAIDAVPHILDALNALEHARHTPMPAGFGALPLPLPISVGRVEGGDWASSVSDWALLEGRIGVAPGETFDEVRSEFEAHMRSTIPPPHDSGIEIEWWGGRFFPLRTPPDSSIVRSMQGALGLQQELPDTGLGAVPYGSDAGLLAHLGDIPTVLFGAGDIREAHRPNESIAVHDLVRMAKVIAATVVLFCGAET